MKNFLCLLILLATLHNRSFAQDYTFNGSMTREKLELYLSRSVTNIYWVVTKSYATQQQRTDITNMLADINARYIGRAFGFYGGENVINSQNYFDTVSAIVNAINTAYTNQSLVIPIIEAGLFELLTTEVDSIEMSDEVANTYGVPKRKFNHWDMLYDDYLTNIAHWNNGSFIPDISKQETQMWFYYIATEFIDRGIEAFHFGQIEEMNDADPNNIYSWDVLQKIRAYGSGKNRGLVLVNAHTYGAYYNGSNQLLFDFHATPARNVNYGSPWTSPTSQSGGKTRLEINNCSPYGETLGGLSPLGWTATTLPYLVELDNYPTSSADYGEFVNTCWGIWGYDEIGWFDLQTEQYRNNWLKCVYSQIKTLDNNAFFQMQTVRITSYNWQYYIAATGYKNQQNTIKEIWDGATTVGTNEIAGNVTWSTNKYIPESIVVKAGGHLTISNGGSTQTVVYMPPEKHIIVEPGGKLTVDGAKITCTCDDCFWGGIQANGQSNLSQTTTNQPVIDIKNGAVIEHAHFGVSLWDRNDAWNSTGGIIKAFNSTFRNNKKAIEFQAYHNHTAGGAPLANLSSFTNCTVEVDDDYKGDAINYPFDSHVTMWEVEGIRFRGCKFYNNISSVDSYRGYGIISYNAGYSVKPYCTGTINYPCNGTLVRSEFKGFISGVIAEGDLNGSLATVAIDRTDFDKNSIGVRIKNVENASVLRSSFDIGNGAETNVTDCYQNAGIFTTNAHSFRIEENTLTGHTYSFQHSGWMNFGVVTEASGDQWNTRDNDIYRCEFLDLSVGAYALGRNSSPYTLSGGATKGLRYLCNRFESNDKDIKVVAPANEGLPSNQWGGFVSGSPNSILSAGNIFTGSSLTPGIIDNTSGHHFTYYHNYGTNSTPSYYFNVTLVKVEENSCDSRLEGGDDPKLTASFRSELESSKAERRDVLSDLKSVYMARMDEGDTEGLIEKISGYSAQEAQDYLMNLVPYISETVFRYVADDKLMSPEMLQEVLVRTPDVLRDPDFLDYLEDQELDRQDLEEASVSTSGRTENEAEMSLYEHELDKAYNFLITDVKNDTLYEYAQTIPELLFEREDLSSAYELMGYYYNIRNIDSAIAVYESIPVRFNLDEDASDIYNAYGTVWDILKTSYGDQVSLEDLGGSNINSLTAIAEGFSGKGIGYIASGLLERAQVIPRPLCVQELPVGRMPIPAKAPKKLPAKEISVYPNPGKDKIIFSYNLPKAQGDIKLVITDVDGRQVRVSHATGNKGLIHWNTGELSNGVYFYQVSDSRQKHGSGKVVIMK